MNRWLLRRSENREFNYLGSTLLALLSNLFTILIQIVAGRSLFLVQFSAFLTAWAIYSLIALATSGIQTTSAIQVAKSEGWKSELALDDLPKFGFDPFTKRLLNLAIVLTVIALLFTPIFSQLLQIQSPLYILSCIAIVPQVLFAIAVGRIQGRYEFIIMNAFGAASTFSRLVATSFVLKFSPTAEYIMIANIAVTFAFAIYGLAKQKMNIVSLSNFSLWDAGRTTTILLVFWAVFNLDMFVSRLSPKGEYYESYAAASSLARTVLLPVVLLTAALVPKLASGLKTNFGGTRWQVLMHFFNLILASFVALFLWIFSKNLTELLLGETNSEVEYLLHMLSVAYLPYAVIYSLVNKRIALGARVNLSLIAIPAIIGISLFLALELPITSLPPVIFIIGIMIVGSMYLQNKFQSRISRLFER